MIQDDDSIPGAFWRALRTPLGRHILFALALKAVLLAAIWHVFVAPARVRADGEAVQARWFHGSGPSVSGNQPREVPDDRPTSR